MLSRLQSHGLTIKPEKCSLGKAEAKYLGYLVTPAGIKPLEHRIRAILDYPKPKDISELRRFLGTLNFYRSSIPRAAETQTPLHTLTAGAKKRDRRSIQ